MVLVVGVAESFLPMYVYDAMKLKKDMRVRVRVCVGGVVGVVIRDKCMGGLCLSFSQVPLGLSTSLPFVDNTNGC